MLQIIEFGHHRVSFVQVRGSIPVYWSQTGVKYRPPPKLDKGRRACLYTMNLFILQVLCLSRIVRKPDFCLGENKGADQLRDQLRGNREADQRLCFRYSDSTIPLLLKSEISSF